MSEPAVEDLINFTFSQTDNSSIRLKNPQLHETSNLGYDFNIDLNKTFDLNKRDHIKASGGSKTILEPFNKHTFDCTNQKKNATGKLSLLESLESDESLGILPDLLNDDLTSKTEWDFSDDEINGDINSEVNENPASLVFSPPCNNQFNRISLFIKNISTPLPNFGNNRRCSSTPKISVASQFVANTADIERFSSPLFLPDEEEPIAGSCQIKFETDFNLDDLKNGKPLTSTYKTFSPPRLSSNLNELGEKIDLKSEVTFKRNNETFENNLNVTQTFSRNIGDLFSCEHKNNIQDVNILNDTFQIKQPVFEETDGAAVSLKYSIPSTMKISQAGSNYCSETKKVKTFDSTFAIPSDEISYNVDCEKTFVVDFNSAIGTEVSSKSAYKDKMLTENHVVEMDSIDFSSQQQEQIANVTFIKDLKNDTQTSLEHCYSSHGTAFKPMTQILEETFSKNDLNPILEETLSKNDLNPILEETLSKNDLNEMLAHGKNVLHCVNSRSQSAFSPDIFNINANSTFSKKVEICPEIKVTQNDNYLIDFASPNSSKALASNIFLKEAGEKKETGNFTESENNLSNKMSFSVALLSIGEADHQGIDYFFKNDSSENVNSIIELASPKSPKELASTTFNEEVGGKISLHNQIDHSEYDYDPVNKMSHSDPLQSINDTILSETNEKSNLVIGKFCKRDSIQNESSSEFAPSLLPRTSKSFTLSHRSEVANILESNVLQDSNDLIGNDTPNLQAIFPRKTAYSLNSNEYDNCHAETKFPEAIEDSVFTGNASEETEFCTRSILEQDYPLEILPKSSNTYASTTFSEKTDQVQLSQNSLKEMTDATFSEKTGEVQIEQISIPTENNEFETSPNSQKVVTNAPLSGLTDKDMMVQPEMQISQCDRDSLGETASNVTKFCLKDTLSRKADKLNSSLKNCLFKPKTVTKSGLIKPTKIVYPRKDSKQRIGQLPIAKPLCKPIDKRSITSDFNRTLNSCDISTDKSFAKNVNRRLTLSCSSESDAKKPKCKNDFKKSFGIPSKLGIRRPESNFQKSRLDIKYSNVHLKDINTIKDKQNLLSQPDFISCKDSTIVKSVEVVSVKAKGTISSKLSLHGKLPLKSLKMKECGLKSNAPTAEKSNNKVISCPKVIDQPRKEKIPEFGINNANSGKNSRHSISTNLPKNFLSFSNIPNKTCNSKPAVIKQKSAPTSNSCKPFSSKPSDTGLVKQRDNTRENTRPTTSVIPSSREQTVLPLNPLNAKKSNGLCKFLPMPKIIKGNVRSMNSNDVKAAQESELQNQVCQQTSGKLPQRRMIPAPRYKK